MEANIAEDWTQQDRTWQNETQFQMNGFLGVLQTDHVNTERDQTELFVT